MGKWAQAGLGSSPHALAICRLEFAVWEGRRHRRVGGGRKEQEPAEPWRQNRQTLLEQIKARQGRNTHFCLQLLLFLLVLLDAITTYRKHTSAPLSSTLSAAGRKGNATQRNAVQCRPDQARPRTNSTVPDLLQGSTPRYDLGPRSSVLSVSCPRIRIWISTSSPKNHNSLRS